MRHLHLVKQNGQPPKVDPSKIKGYRKKPITILAVEMEEDFEVETLEGVMKGKAGDFLIEGVEGEMYPCKREIFLKTYEEAR